MPRTTTTTTSSNGRPKGPSIHDWSYEEAVSRNLGLIGEKEQETLRSSRIAVIGMGGVGGAHLLTLTRLGIGGFSIADPDEFETANFNRQHCANTETISQNKARVLAEQASAINPRMELQVLTEPVSELNVDKFLDGADLLIDGVDFFNIEVRRLVFREARRRGIWALTAAPLGFGCAWLVFSPRGLSFDDYFDIDDSMPRTDQLIAFAIGLAPRPAHLPYMDFTRVDLNNEQGPSVSLACQLCSGIAASEAVRILNDKSSVKCVPHYRQFDARRHMLRKGYMPFGNRNMIQRIKRRIMKRYLTKKSVL